MLGRAVLAWVIADNIDDFAPLPGRVRRAGALADVRRGPQRRGPAPAAAAGSGCPQAGARASVYGTVAGAIVAAARHDRVLARSTVATAGGERGLHRRRGGRAEPARQRPTPTRPRWCPQAFQLPWRHRARERRQVPLAAGSCIAALVGSAALRAAVRLPVAVPRLRDPRGGWTTVLGIRRPGGPARPGRRRARRSARSWPPRSAPGCASAGRCGCRPSGSGWSR